MIHPQRRWSPPGLYFRVLAALVTAIIIVLGISTVVSVSTSQARLRQDLLDRGQDELRVLKLSSSVYFSQRDTHQLILIAKAATDGGQPLFVAFYDSQGSMLAAAAAPDAPDTARRTFDTLPQQAQSTGTEQIRWAEDALEIVQPVVYYGEPSGAIAMRIGTASLRADFERGLFSSIITTLMLTLILSLLVGLLLRQLIIVPLRRLSAASDQISAGNWIIPSGHERSDEFGTVARSFGQMVQTLQARETQLHEQVVAVQALNTELDERVAERTQELQSLVSLQEQLLAQIQEMSTPVVPVLDGVIVVPLIGNFDGQRASQLVQSILGGIEQHSARVAVLDITGAMMVDTQVAGTIVKVTEAARLLGTTVVLVGVRPEVAQTLVQLGIDLAHIRTSATLQEAIQQLPRRPRSAVAQL